MNHLIAELKPSLTEIITQGIALGDIHFEYPAALAEIVLIILAVKLNNTFLASTAEDSEETIRGLVALLEKGTGVPQGTCWRGPSFTEGSGIMRVWGCEGSRRKIGYTMGGFPGL